MTDQDGMSFPTWDIFISHASEDGDSVARPLAEALQQAGLRVWLDSLQLTVGDSLREQIDRALSCSRFGVVVLSASFLAKRWPQQELSGLFALEEGTRKKILPVWHEVTRAQVAARFPMVADRLAVSTVKGIAPVAQAICRRGNGDR